MPEKDQLVPYELVEPGWEAIYTGETLDTPDDSTDAKGNVIGKWATWPFVGMGIPWADWGAEAKVVDQMQAALGPLSDEIRRIRAQVGSLVPCDSGVPVSIDGLLQAIGAGKLTETVYRCGCWNSDGNSTQPRQTESMRIIETVLRGYLAGTPSEQYISEYPHAAGFVRRTYNWLGPAENLTQVQRLLLERMLLPFDYFTRTGALEYDFIMQVSDACFGDEGAGAKLDQRICELTGLPEIQRLRYGMYEKHLETIEDEKLRDLYTVCTRISGGVYELSYCHHNTFRVIEGQIHGIASGKIGTIPGRTQGAEHKRLGQLLFGYALALDRWLLGQPMQFLLLDLGHVDLGFDPKNEILRVYAYLGEERDAVKEWLVAALWCNLYHNPHGGLQPHAEFWRDRHAELLAKVADVGVSARAWMDLQLQ